MNSHADKKRNMSASRQESQSVSNGVAQKQRSNKSVFQFVDNRHEAITQRKLQEAANNSLQVKQLMAFKEMANYSLPIQKMSVIQRVEINTKESNFTLTMKGDKADIWTSNDGKWHFSYYRDTGDYHIKGESGGYKPFQKGIFNGEEEERTSNKHKNASNDAIMSGRFLYWVAVENIVPLY